MDGLRAKTRMVRVLPEDDMPDGFDVSGPRPCMADSVYSLSKAGVVLFTRTLGEQWKEHGVRVNQSALDWCPLHVRPKRPH